MSSSDTWKRAERAVARAWRRRGHRGARLGGRGRGDRRRATNGSLPAAQPPARPARRRRVARGDTLRARGDVRPRGDAGGFVRRVHVVHVVRTVPDVRERDHGGRHPARVLRDTRSAVRRHARVVRRVAVRRAAPARAGVSGRAHRRVRPRAPRLVACVLVPRQPCHRAAPGHRAASSRAGARPCRAFAAPRDRGRGLPAADAIEALWEELKALGWRDIRLRLYERRRTVSMLKRSCSTTSRCSCSRGTSRSTRPSEAPRRCGSSRRAPSWPYAAAQRIVVDHPCSAPTCSTR